MKKVILGGLAAAAVALGLAAAGADPGYDGRVFRADRGSGELPRAGV
jgi:hypothetical protein